MDRRNVTPWPWTLVDCTNSQETNGYLRIEGPKGEKIADIFPFAGAGGVGAAMARANGAIIVEAVRGLLVKDSAQAPAPLEGKD